MTKNEIETYVKHKADIVEQVLVWLVRDIAIYHCHNSTNYLTKLKSIHDRAVSPSGKKTGNYALKEFSTLFHFDEKFIELICGGRPRIEGCKTRLTKQILSLVKANSDVLQYIGKKNATYKSGKKFSHHGWWMIDTRKVEALFDDKAWDKPSSKRCSAEARYVISKIAFYYAKLKLHRYNLTLKKLNIITKDKTMTKAEKEKLKEECEKGLHCLPYDYMVKSIEKEERTKLRTLQTRIRKMTQKAMVELTHENEMLKAENEALKAKVKHLEELKDINSDIPDDDDNIDYEKLNEELDEAEKLAAGCPNPTNVFVAPPELAEKKVVETPADDIPTPTSEEVTKLEKQINRLQEFVNKLYISVNEARRIASFFGRSIDLKEARGGWCVEDAHKHKGQRSTIFGYFKHELDNHQLVTDDAAKFFKGRT